MAQIKLGARPEAFKHAVSFPMLDGTTGTIEVTYRYRTRSEYGRFLDEWRAKREASIKAEQDARQKKLEAQGADPEQAANTSSEDMQRLISSAAADFVMEIATGWNLVDTEFNRENVEQLADEYPAAVAAIQDDYLLAITQGKRGNF